MLQILAGLPAPRSLTQTHLSPAAFDAPIRDLSLAPRSLLGEAAKQKPRYYCQRSKYTLVAPAEDGLRRLYHAPCKSNRCEYCGRVNMYKKRNRLNDRMAEDRATGLAESTAYEFVTATIREGACSVEDAFRYIKKAMSYAVKCVRKSRKYNKSYRRASWGGCEIEYVHDVDIQPFSKMPHTHSLFAVRFPHARKKLQGVEELRSRYSRRLAKELHYYANNWLRKRLGLATMRWKEGSSYPYQGTDSLLYVHFSKMRSSQNAINYMALHNGKIWTDGREYPRRYRRFSTSRGFLPKLPDKEPSGYEFVKDSLYRVCQKLVGSRVKVSWEDEDRAHDGNVLAVTIADPGDTYHCWETASGIQRQVDTKNSYRLAYALGRAPSQKEVLQETVPYAAWPKSEIAQVMEKMAALEAYWASNADRDGGSVERIPSPLRAGYHGPPELCSRFAPGVTFVEWQRGLANCSLSSAAPYRWQDDPWVEASADPFADDLPAALVEQAIELSRSSGQTFSVSVAMIERVNAGVAAWAKKMPHPRR